MAHSVPEHEQEEDGGGPHALGGQGAAHELPHADLARAVLLEGLVADAPALYRRGSIRQKGGSMAKD